MSERLGKPTCLLIASSAAAGVSAQSFLQCFTLSSSAFNLQVATPGCFHFSPEPICAVGHGVAALCCATSEDKSWVFQGYSLTGPSVYELIRQPNFASLSIIVEDFVRDSGATFSASKPDAVHVVLDRHLVTGQNENSTLPAVQNLLILCNVSVTELACSLVHPRDVSLQLEANQNVKIVVHLVMRGTIRAWLIRPGQKSAGGNIRSPGVLVYHVLCADQ
ncbi:hypothetical protein ASZ78_010171 [Callipepla squamata]|uniref:Glutamine amidotransferase-like class 1 domain-containing protein 1 n=1 Tax=Callipepla squamata TaxID=9009 RepID=A0A226MQ66_CALSU|nr:hypothetical protein ASZ78_010171 [Callipepla squamata]